MKKNTLLLPAILLCLLMLAGCATPAPTAQPTSAPSAAAASPAAATAQPAPTETPAPALRVIASFYPMYDFAQKIGGDKIELTNIVPAGMEPHDWEPVPQDIATLEQADILVYNGAGMEHWVEDVLASLGNKNLIAVETAQGIELLERHGHENGHDEEHEEEHQDEHADEDDHDHDHGDHDPHTWLSPANAKIQMENIKNAFAAADPDNAAYYEQNYATYAAELDQLDQEFRDALLALPRKEIVVSHQAFGYLCHAYGLTQVSIRGVSAEAEPDPQSMASIIDFAKEHEVKVIFFEEMVDPKVSQTIADAIGAQTLVLSPIEGLSDAQKASGGDYFSVMRENLASLVTALS